MSDSINHPVADPVLLLTGFEPFAAFAVNPSSHAAREAAMRAGPSVMSICLPVDYLAARETLLSTLEVLRPAACLCMGLAAGDKFRFEQRARKPAQFATIDGPVVIEGNWPWAVFEERLTDRGVRHRRSLDAGRYVCESTYWTLLDFAARNGFPGQCGFLHVPAVSPAFPLETIIEVVCDLVDRYRETLIMR